MRVVVYSRKHSVQCYNRENSSGRDPGFCGWAELEPEVLWAGEMNSIPRTGEYVSLFLPGRPMLPPATRLEVIDVQYPLPQPADHAACQVYLIVNWYNQEKMTALIKEKEKR